MYYKMTDLLNLALASPKIGMINCFMLHTLLHAMIKRLDIGDTRVKIPERPDEIAMPFKKDPLHKEIKTEEAEPEPSHGILTDSQKQTKPEIPAETVETMTTDPPKLSSKKYPSSQVVSENQKRVKISSTTELSGTAPSKPTISMHSPKQELVKDLDQKSNETEFKVPKPSSNPNISNVSEGTVDYPQRYYSIGSINETITGGIPYVESQVNELFTKLNYLPPVESMDQLFELLENHSQIRKEEDEKYINAKADYLKNIGAILDKIELMDMRLKKFEGITFIYNIEEIVNKLHSLDMKLEELQDASLLKNIGDMMNKTVMISDRQEGVLSRLGKAEDDIGILEEFMKQVEVMESEKKKVSVDDDVLNRLTVAERKLDLKLERLEESIKLMHTDNKSLKNAISNIELEKFSKSNTTMTDREPSRVKDISTNEVNEATKELEKRLEEQKKYFTNQLQYFNQLLSSKSDRWELEWFQIWLEKSLKTHLKSSKKSWEYEMDETIVVKRRLNPETCLSCNKPVVKKLQFEDSLGKSSGPQVLKGKQMLAKKNAEKRADSALCTSHTDAYHHRKQHVRKYWGKRHEIWLEGTDGRFYKGSDDYSITINPRIYRKKEPSPQRKEKVAFVKTPEINESNVSSSTVSKTVHIEKSSSSTQQIKDGLCLYDNLQVPSPTKKSQSLTTVAEFNDNTEEKPGKATIYASASRIESVQMLASDSFKDFVPVKKADGVGEN
ncbi:Hypothetical predicted protein [Octopus vulgaris]|uniref:Uncharacterized protein n=1 Tax=Octopus vulgaris TaxID=6645 RepID=A0AA36AHS5_OCTVU|nr:Hypothetical predicted protein [Octopus vulgaris]